MKILSIISHVFYLPFHKIIISPMILIRQVSGAVLRYAKNEPWRGLYPQPVSPASRSGGFSSPHRIPQVENPGSDRFFPEACSEPSRVLEQA
jgi:hypothetical protein